VGEDVVPFRVEASDEELEDLCQRLARTRWPEPATAPGWTQGVPVDVARDLCGHWARDYDLRAAERRLNAFPQFRTEIDGLGIHFLHVPSPEPRALPLVMSHGWPGSFVEFLDVIGPLTDPAAHGGDREDAFSMVCPSLPGYGWSDRPTESGWGVERIADAWAALMARLGYERYGAQGGDWGAMVTTLLGARHPDHLAGVHVTMPIAGPEPGQAEFDDAEQAALAALTHYLEKESGYSTEQATRPQTIGYGLVDSPAALCTWIVEKFWAWTDTGDDPVGTLGADRLLDNVMAYWLPATGASSARLYWESLRRPPADTVQVPAGVSQFPRELFRPPRHWVARQFTDLRYWNELDRGGHFAAMEQPELFVEEVRAFFRLVR
jgi:epoxide hydrolase